MSTTRRTAIGVLGRNAPAVLLKRAVGAYLSAGLEIEKGPFRATRETTSGVEKVKVENVELPGLKGKVNWT